LSSTFSLNTLPRCCSLLLAHALAAIDAAHARANSLSIPLIFYSATILGAHSGQAGHRKPLPVATTTQVCVGFTSLLGAGNLLVSLLPSVVIAFVVLQGVDDRPRASRPMAKLAVFGSPNPGSGSPLLLP
jgi:hypothetical protein